MEGLGVIRRIRRVDSPTDSCAGMVVVAKPKATPSSAEGGASATHRVRIYVDLTWLNESVRRE